MPKRKPQSIPGPGGTEQAKAKKAKATTHKLMGSQSSSNKLVERINALDAQSLKIQYVEDQWLHYQSKGNDAQEFSLELADSDHLTPGEHNSSFFLVETTSRHDYELSTSGWHPRNKRKEMLEPEMRYLFVRRQGAEPTIEKDGQLDVDTSIEGFMSFMITYDSSPSMPVLYIYEIHLAASLRGVGLGAHLMVVAGKIAESVGMAKVMLTCFLCNEKAHGFYESQGYSKDVSSPDDRKTRNKIVKLDYVIMGKLVETGMAGQGDITGNGIKV